MENKKQTAVEWLVIAITNNMTNNLSSEIGALLVELFDEAKAMEKEQIIEANEDCSTNELGELFTGEQYYTSIYGK